MGRERRALLGLDYDVLGVEHGVFDWNEYGHVKDGDDGERARIGQEVDVLRVAQREHEDETRDCDGVLSIKVPVLMKSCLAEDAAEDLINKRTKRKESVKVESLESRSQR